MPPAAERLHGFIERAPFRRRLTETRKPAPVLPMPRLSLPAGETMSTQEGFGRLMLDLAKSGSALAERVVTTSPDVTVSTNLGGWVNQVGLFAHTPHSDVFKDRKLLSAQKWVRSLEGRHIELGIAENNLFLLLAALGLAEPLFGQRLLPVGTVYDPFISRGLDALNYACYQDARFLLVATPSGITLAPEGGAHQSIIAPLIGLGQPGLTMFEPAFVDELAAILRWSFDHLQQEEGGGSVYLRLSTRPIEQPKRALDEAQVTTGAYWLREPAPGAEIAVIATGAVLPEAIEAVARLGERHAKIGLLAVTSADRLHAGWLNEPGTSSQSIACWRRSRAMRCWRPSSTAIPPPSPGWARCAASGSPRWASTASASPATFRISMAITGSMPRPSPRRWRGRCAVPARHLGAGPRHRGAAMHQPGLSAAGQ